MVASAAHGILVNGAALDGIARPRPVLLQMSDADFPARFLRDLASPGQPQLSTARNAAPDSTGGPPVLFQPVQRVLHLAVAQLACDALAQPRVDPTRVLAAGIVVRRVVRDSGGIDRPGQPPEAWLRAADGTFRWTPLDRSQEDLDPDPGQRPAARSGQTALDLLLAAQSRAAAATEISTPAFVAPPEVCDSLGRTVAYAIVPTASSETADAPPAAPQYDSAALASALPTLLKAGGHVAPQAGNAVDYRYLSDDYAAAQNASDFQVFSAALRLLHTVCGLFGGSPEAAALLALLDRYNVYFGSGASAVPRPMGQFYADAADALIDYDPNATPPVPAPQLRMPDAWDAFSPGDQDAIVAAVAATLRRRAATVAAPEGRFQDATRLYRLRLFFRLKSERPACPPQLAWSAYSEPFRIAAWYENDGSGRALPPIALPDPTQRDFLKHARPNCTFAVPAGLMNSMQAAGMSKLMKGDSGSGPNIQLDWICGFNIPLITICAFFVLNIFLTLLNIVFFWLPFIKICIPFPMPKKRP